MAPLRPDNGVPYHPLSIDINQHHATLPSWHGPVPPPLRYNTPFEKYLCRSYTEMTGLTITQEQLDSGSIEFQPVGLTLRHTEIVVFNQKLAESIAENFAHRDFWLWNEYMGGMIGPSRPYDEREQEDLKVFINLTRALKLSNSQITPAEEFLLRINASTPVKRSKLVDSFILENARATSLEPELLEKLLPSVFMDEGLFVLMGIALRKALYTQEWSKSHNDSLVSDEAKFEYMDYKSALNERTSDEEPHPMFPHELTFHGAIDFPEDLIFPYLESVYGTVKYYSIKTDVSVKAMFADDDMNKKLLAQGYFMLSHWKIYVTTSSKELMEDVSRNLLKYRALPNVGKPDPFRLVRAAINSDSSDYSDAYHRIMESLSLDIKSIKIEEGILNHQSPVSKPIFEPVQASPSVSETLSGFRKLLEVNISRGLESSALPSESKDSEVESEDAHINIEEEHDAMVNGRTVSEKLGSKTSGILLTNPNYDNKHSLSGESGSKSGPSFNENHNATFYLNDEDYTRFVYDELDEDEDFHQLVDNLADLFPTYRRTELKIRVKLSEDIDALVEELFLEQETNELMEALREEEDLIMREQQKPKYSPAVYQLKDIFPSFDNDTLSFALDEAHGDLEIATNNLLVGNVSSFKQAGTFNGTSQKELLKERGWDSIQDTAKHLSATAEIPLSDATSFLHDKNGSFIEGLIAVINTYKSTLPSLPKPKSNIPRGGRVQRGGAAASGRISSVEATRDSFSQYKFNPYSPEYEELKALLRSNPQFKGIGIKFCERALEHFHGNPFKVIDICRIVLEYNCEHLTQERQNTIDYRLLTKASNASAGAGIKMAPKSSTALSSQFARFRTKSSAINEPEAKTQNALLENCIRTGQLDLHGLRLTTALRVTQKALTSWWSKEVASREYEGNLRKYGSKASFMSPVRVITGRGLHSVGGVPVIKMGVKNYLVKNKYVYDENVGSYIVQGKKT